jgi:hypothetical protein
VDQPQLLKSLCIVNSAPEVKLRSRDDYWQWFKRWSLMRVLSLAPSAKPWAAIVPKPEQADCGKKWPNAGQKTTNVLISPASMPLWAGAFRNDFRRYLSNPHRQRRP